MLRIESVKDSAEIQTQQQQASNVAIIGEVRNPGGVIINKNQFNSGSDDNKNDDGLFTHLSQMYRENILLLLLT